MMRLEKGFYLYSLPFREKNIMQPRKLSLVSPLFSSGDVIGGLRDPLTRSTSGILPTLQPPQLDPVVQLLVIEERTA